MDPARKRKLRTSLLITLAAAAGAGALSGLDMFRKLELSSLNTRYHLKGRSAKPTRDVVCVAISNQAVKELGERWPWPRSYFARLVRNLKKAGALAIGIDVMFDVSQAEDSLLAAAIREAGNVVLAGGITGGVREPQRMNGPSPELLKVMGYDNNRVAFVNMQGDLDGYHRRYLPFTFIRNRQYNSFALELVRIARCPDKGDFTIREENNAIILDTTGYRIPLFDRRHFLINFYGPPVTFPFYHFDAVIDDSSYTTRMEQEMEEELNTYYEFVADRVFKDKIVVVGAPLAELHDNFLTPFYDEKQVQMSGMEVHANVVQMILDQNYLFRLNRIIQGVITILLVGFIYLFVNRFRIITGFLCSAGVMVGYTAVVMLAFTRFNLVMDLITPVLVMLILVYISNVSYSYMLEQREKRLITGMFEHYVPRDVVRELVRDPEKLTLQGEKRVLTVLFSDIEGFTTLAEGMVPEQLVSMLREYLTEMTQIVIDQGGIIDKYEGDALIAEFGIPIRLEDHAYRACLTALKMQTRLEAMREKWREEGKPQFRIRIGISTGEMVFGNLGSDQVFDYTVLGDVTNVGSRLETANKFYGTKILISEDTCKHCRDRIVVRELDTIQVLGKTKPVTVYHLIGLAQDFIDQRVRDRVGIFEKGLSLYRIRQWDDARVRFQQVLDDDPADLAALVFVERCNKYKQEAPPADWNGVFVMTAK